MKKRQPSKTPHTMGGGGLDIWQPIKRCYDWMDHFGFRTNWELILGLSTSVHPVYQLLYEFNAWLYMYNLVVLIVLISTMIYRWCYEQRPKCKTNGEQMATLGELFEGYEPINWWVDTINGDDSNTGLTHEEALATTDEAEKRSLARVEGQVNDDRLQRDTG